MGRRGVRNDEDWPWVWVIIDSFHERSNELEEAKIGLCFALK